MNKNNQGPWGLNTKLNHPKRITPREGNAPTVAPIYQAAKFVIPKDMGKDDFLYTRLSNPTLRQLEVSLADIQSREDCLVFSSGIAAITHSLLSLLKSGDHVITFRELYKPSRMFIRDILPQYGIESSVLRLNDFETLERSIRPGKTKLIHFESPTNPNLHLADIEKISQIAKSHGILLSMDGTFAGLHQHHEFPIDIIIHSLTKYANGHGDVLAGSVAGSRKIISQIRKMSIFLGATLDPHAAFLIERGLKTYMLRYDRQSQNSLAIANYLDQHPMIAKVYYPGLHSDEFQLAKKQMKDMGGVLSFELDTRLGMTAEEFVHKLQFIQYAASLGSTETLIAPTRYLFGDDLSEVERDEIGINDFSLRLSVGIEDASDIIHDLSQALNID